MKPTIDLISIVTSQFDKMRTFYIDVIGFKTTYDDKKNYCEFESNTVRFAITTNDVMFRATGHESFTSIRKGQSFELAFKVATTKEVDSTYTEWVEKGAIPIKSPENMPWHQRTAFIADPDGNIHEIFTDLEK